MAEFTACILMDLYGYGDRSGNAWQYIANYADDPIEAVLNCLETVETVLKTLEV